MKYLFPVLFICCLLAACGTPAKKTSPARSVASSPPAASEEKAETRLPLPSLKRRILTVAQHEWQYFDRQTVFMGETEESIPHVGAWEDEDGAYPERINQYWRAVGKPGLDGHDCQQPWSAAFVSWVMQAAGVSRDVFPPGGAHWIYLSHMLAHADTEATFVPHTRQAYSPKPGDLICASREDYLSPYIEELPTADWLESARLHCDIVVNNDGKTLEAIGGNVRNSVSKSILTLSPEGFLQPTQHRRWFLIIENRLY